MKRAEKAAPARAEPPEEEKRLREIRDALRK